MQFKSTLVVAAASLAAAQTSLCDKYTTALLMDNNSTNQYTLLVLLVNTALIGNYVPKPTGSNVDVQGILNPAGTFNNETVNLTPYFTGGLASTNRDNAAVSVNFVDDGGAAALNQSMPALGTSSNQYTLLTHLYSFFGTLLGCSQVGSMGFPAYAGDNSQYDVHKFMDLNPSQVGYFIQEVGAAALSFGVTMDDVTTVATTLTNVFNYRCTAAYNLTSSDAELQSICIDPTCPIAETGADCSPYDAVLAPLIATSSLAGGEGVSSTVTLLASGATSGTAAATGSASGSASASASGSASASASGSGTSSKASASASGSATPAASSSSFAYATAAPALGAFMAAGALALAL